VSEQDFYQVLGISNDAGTKEIKEAYHKLAFQYHPDRNQGNQAASERMMEINEAYVTLSDPDKRREHDLLLERNGRRIATFKKGDKVRVRMDSPSPFTGRTGVIDEEPLRDHLRLWYMVKFESRGLATIGRLAVEELEKVSHL
jgi:curved DNA-binding protein CbpA